VLKGADELVRFVQAKNDDKLVHVSEAILRVRKLLGPDVLRACEAAAHLLSEELKKHQITAKILQGEVPIGISEWLEHRVVIVELSDLWLIVDLSAAQLTQFNDAEFVVLVTSPTAAELRKALAAYYSWWNA
jgi:hypothetical protein